MTTKETHDIKTDSSSFGVESQLSGRLEKRCAVVIRFEDCLCEGKAGQRTNVLPLGGPNRKWHNLICAQDLAPQAEECLNPVELKAKILRISSDLHWKRGAIWFLKALSRSERVSLFIVTDEYEEIVRRKMHCIPVSGEIVGTVLQYDTESGRYRARCRMDERKRAAFVATLLQSGEFSQVICIGSRFDDLSSLTKGTGIFVGHLPLSTGPGQFSVKNLVEAVSTLKTILAHL